MSERHALRLWNPGVWVRHRRGERIVKPLCIRYRVETAFATAAWLAVRWDSDVLIEDPVQGLVWTVTKHGEVR